MHEGGVRLRRAGVNLKRRSGLHVTGVRGAASSTPSETFKLVERVKLFKLVKIANWSNPHFDRFKDAGGSDPFMAGARPGGGAVAAGIRWAKSSVRRGSKGRGGEGWAEGGWGRLQAKILWVRSDFCAGR